MKINYCASLLFLLLILTGNSIPLKAQVVIPENIQNVTPPTNMPPEEQVSPEAPLDEEMIEAAGFSAAAAFRIFETVLDDARARDRYRINRPRQQELDVIIRRLEASFPMSFEYHYAQWLNHHLDTTMGFHLKEAYRLAPDQSVLLDDLVAHYELTGDLEHKTLYCKQIEEETLYDPALYSYARNLFKSIPSGAFLFTRGEWDTYPLWVLQHVHGERTDVTILQIDLLHQEHYFNRMMKQFALRRGAYRRFLRDKPAFFRELAEASKKQQMFLSLTLDRDILENNAEILYNTGLAMKLTTGHFNNLTALTDNWNSFDQEHLSKKHDNPELAKMMGNYIFPLALLHQQALANRRNEEAMELKSLMTMLARSAGLGREMERYLGE